MQGYMMLYNYVPIIMFVIEYDHDSKPVYILYYLVVFFF